MKNLKTKMLFLLLGLLTILSACEGTLPLGGLNDDTAPIMVSIYPASGTTNAAKNTIVSVQFDDAMDPTSFFMQDVERFYVTRQGETNRISLDPSYTENGTKIILAGSTDFIVGQTYTVTIEPGIKNIAQLDWVSAGNYTWDFTVADRVDNVETKMSFTSPATNHPDGIHHAYYAENFSVNGSVVLPDGFTVYSVEYKLQSKESGNWNALSTTTDFSLLIDINDSVWNSYPQTNWVHFKVVGTQGTNEVVSYHMLPFIIDKWDSAQFGSAFSHGIDYWKTSSEDYASYCMTYSSPFLGFVEIGSTSERVLSGMFGNSDISYYNNKVHIVAESPSTPPAAKYYYKSNSTWYNGSFVNLGNGEYSSPQIDVSTVSGGLPISAFIFKVDGASINTLYVTSNMNPLSTYTVDTGNFNSVKMAYDRFANTAHLLSDEDGGNNKLYYRKYLLDGVSVDTYLGTVKSSSKTDYYRASSICLDSSRNPHIAYIDKSSNDIKYVDVVGGDSGTLSVSSLPGSGTIDSIDIFHVGNRAYIVYMRNRHIYVTYRSAGQWFGYVSHIMNNANGRVRIRVLPNGSQYDIYVLYVQYDLGGGGWQLVSKATATRY